MLMVGYGAMIGWLYTEMAVIGCLMSFINTVCRCWYFRPVLVMSSWRPLISVLHYTTMSKSSPTSWILTVRYYSHSTMMYCTWMNLVTSVISDALDRIFWNARTRFCRISDEISGQNQNWLVYCYIFHLCFLFIAMQKFIMTSCIYTHTHTQPFYCCSGICPGPPGWAGIEWAILIFCVFLWLWVCRHYMMTDKLSPFCFFLHLFLCYYISLYGVGNTTEENSCIFSVTQVS